MEKETKTTLESEFQYYIQHQDELVELYDGRYIVIAGQRVVGDYATFAEAVTETLKTRQQGTFIVQRCSEGPKDYTFTYHSRVRIPHAATTRLHA